MSQAKGSLAPRWTALLIVISIIFGLSPAWGQPLVCAEPVAGAIANVRVGAPDGVVFETREGAVARSIVARFNAYPPPSDVEADQVTIGISPDLPRGVVIFGLRGCFVATYFVGTAVARSLLGEGA